ncbi:MAG: hypothetical protein MUC96_05935 [Myxococcaceae bacterium]|jgi:hypothetical protein|nr:hypothetical protein [Myxococcaceae bacterium]
MELLDASTDQRVQLRMPWEDFVRFLELRYVRRKKSQFLPGLDLTWLARLVIEPDNAWVVANLVAAYRRN